MRATFALLLLAFISIGASAGQVSVDVALGQPVLPADKKVVTWVKVGLTGFALKNHEDRAPINVALVLDKSGSMQGEKIKHAREAAIAALDRLNGSDIVSVIAFDDKIEVVLPATKLTDKAAVRRAIERIEADGSTNLFGGVSKGAEELRKFLDKQRVNRVVLLSDGQANVGPSSPRDLGDLGQSFRKEGIAVTTIGLGLDYNEDLMSELARRSDGNHYFAKHASDLEKIFKHEFGDVTAVVAQEVCVEIKCADGIRPVRVLGRDAEISSQSVIVQMNQIYSEQQKFVMLEVEVPATDAGKTRDIATTTITYANMATKTNDKLTSSVKATFSARTGDVEKNENPKVMVDAITLIGNEQNKKAVELRDQGKVEEARVILLENSEWLGKKGEQYNNEFLKFQCRSNSKDAGNLEGEQWNANRKKMRGNQSVYQDQSSWSATE